MSLFQQRRQPLSLKTLAGLAIVSSAAAVAAWVEYHSRRVAIVAGASDAVVDIEAHSKRLHEALPGSRLVVVPGAGHMVHYAAQQQIAEAVSVTSAAIPWVPQRAAEPALVAQ